MSAIGSDTYVHNLYAHLIHRALLVLDLNNRDLDKQRRIFSKVIVLTSLPTKPVQVSGSASLSYARSRIAGCRSR